MKKGWKKPFFALAILAVCLIITFPVFWIVLTSLKPADEVYYVWRTTNFTLHNFYEAWKVPRIQEAFFNSAAIATLATVFSLLVTIPSGYVLSRFRGWAPRTWFGTIYLFRTIPYITWVLPLYLVTQYLGIFDTYLGLLLPHIAIHVCFFSWIMKGFFDGLDPDLENAAFIDGCSRWGALIKVIMPLSTPGVTALFVLAWLYTWNEFMFALILTGGRTPIITVQMAQYVHELGIEWHLMSATATMALIPCVIVTLFAQKYVVAGLRI
ncbi:MAG: carbohydrate ABC transporter permease [Nitrospinota bacterium]|nr:MAG: carbohydrate ABC transporter permease [Nitrospinota bacterium]